MSISGEKDALRAQLRARLSQSDPAENAACDVRITLQVLSLPAFQAAFGPVCGILNKTPQSTSPPGP